MNNTQTIETSMMPKTFKDPAWDTISARAREQLVTELTIKQVEFARAEVPFYTKLYANVRTGDLNDTKDCAQHIPAITKDMIRALPSPYDMLPQSVRNDMGRLWLHRGTGGTTGPPTSVFYTRGDYDANMDGNYRVTRLAQVVGGGLIAFNGYNQGHISGPYFDDVVRRLGACTISRNFGSTDEAAIKQLALHKCNCIIGPPVSTHKGGSFADLLDADVKTGTNYINGENIKLLVFSSTGMTRELYDEFKDLGIKAFVNIYGSTDVCTVAESPPYDPFELILTFGHNSAYAVNDKQEHVGDNERGLLIASRIGSYDAAGNIIPNQGTQLINFHLGDEVTWHQKCSVGPWNVPSISGVHRAAHLKDKIEGGCERW